MKILTAAVLSLALALTGCTDDDPADEGTQAPTAQPTSAATTEPGDPTAAQPTGGLVLDSTVIIDGAAHVFDTPDPTQPLWCISTAPDFSIRLASSQHEGLFGMDDLSIEIEFPDESYSGRFDTGSAPGTLTVDHGQANQVNYAVQASYEGTLVVDSTRGSGAEQTVDVSINITCSDDEQG